MKWRNEKRRSDDECGVNKVFDHLAKIPERRSRTSIEGTDGFSTMDHLSWKFFLFMVQHLWRDSFRVSREETGASDIA